MIYLLAFLMLPFAIIGFIAIYFVYKAYMNQKAIRKLPDELVGKMFTDNRIASAKDYQMLFDYDARGRLVLQQLVKMFYSEPFDTDTHKMSFKCGERTPVAFIIGQIQKGKQQ